jgi:hypothetical protein
MVAILTRLSVFFRIFKYLWTMLISSHVACHNFLEDVHEDSMQIPSQLAGSCATVRTGLWRHLDVLQCLEASKLKTSEHQGNTIRTLGQASSISTRSWISVDTYLVSFCKMTGWYPVFQNIPGFLYKRGKELQGRPSGRSAKGFRHGHVLGRIALF